MFKGPEMSGKKGLDLYSSPEGLQMANELYESNKEKINELLKRGLIDNSDLESLKAYEENLRLLLPNGFSPNVAAASPLVARNISQYNKTATKIINTKGRGVNFDETDGMAA